MSREPLRIALIGFGNVGTGLAEILRDHASPLEAASGARFSIVAVSDLRRGSVHDPDGLEPAALLNAVAATDRLDGVAGPDHGWDALTTIARAEADVVVELSYTDLRTGEPALSHIRAALLRGRHVVTTNKGPVALAWSELSGLAAARGLQIGVEGTVMSGTPILRMARELLAPAGIRRIEGILNGTTNYVLSRIEVGLSYTEALAEAQALGFAEADPTADIEGHDAAGKLAILSTVVLGQPVRPADIPCRGISGFDRHAVAAALARGRRWKLIATLEAPVGDKPSAEVAPRALPLDHPLAGVMGATNAVTVTTDLLGEVTIVGPGAGRLPTGYAVIEDLLAIHAGIAARHVPTPTELSSAGAQS